MGTGLTVEMIRMGQKRAPIQTRNLKAFDCISGWYTVYRPIANLGMGVCIIFLPSGDIIINRDDLCGGMK